MVGEYALAAGYTCSGKVEKMAAAHLGTSLDVVGFDDERAERDGAGGMFSSSGYSCVVDMLGDKRFRDDLEMVETEKKKEHEQRTSDPFFAPVFRVLNPIACASATFFSTATEQNKSSAWPTLKGKMA